MVNLRKFGNLIVEGLEVQAFADLAPSTLQKRRHLKFLIDKLRQRKINYTWGFPFRLLVDYRNKKIIIRTIEEAHIFIEFLDKEEQDLLQQASDREGQSRLSIEQDRQVEALQAELGTLVAPQEEIQS